MGKKSVKRKQHTGGVQPLVYEGKIGEKLRGRVMKIRAATREENLEEKVLLKIAEAWDRHGEDPEMLMQHLVNIIANDAGYGEDEHVLPVYNKIVTVIDREHNAMASASQTETVLVTKASSREAQAPVRQTSGQKHRVKAGRHQTSTTLGEALSLRSRLTKPRGGTLIDELLWAGALTTAQEETRNEFDIKKPLDEYYHSMCQLGKSLLADDLNKRTQRIYDVRASRKFVKEAKGFKRTRKLKKHELDELD